MSPAVLPKETYSRIGCAQLKGYAASCLAAVYDAHDLAYLNIIGVPAVLRDYVQSGGIGLHLSVPHTSYRSDLVSSATLPNTGCIALQRRASPAGSLWCGMSEVYPGAAESPAREMMLRMVAHTGGSVRGFGASGGSAFTLRGTAKDSKTFEFETLESGNVRAVYNVQVLGRKMVGTWSCNSPLKQSGQVTLHRTVRQPVPPSYFSRVNEHHIKFVGSAVVFTGTTQIGVVQAAVPLSAENSYFEVQVLDKGKECAIAVGVAHRNYPLDQMPGWRNGSIAYHMDDGKLFFQRGQGNRFGEKCGEGDVVGCGVELAADGASIVSVYWTRNGELAGRELCASVLHMPLYASVALHSQGESVFIFEAPPPACLAGNSAGLVNSAGDPVRLGTDRGFSHLYYCGQRQSNARTAGPEALCGPSGGAQCSICEALQESVGNREQPDSAEPWPAGDLAAASGGSDGGGGGEASMMKFAGGPRGLQWAVEAEMRAARESLWRLLRILVLQVSEQLQGGKGEQASGLAALRGKGPGFGGGGDGLVLKAHRCVVDPWPSQGLGLRVEG
jgi:hypothetical protein